MPTPASVTGLHDHRWRGQDVAPVAAREARDRVWQPGTPEQARGQELVVDGQERACVVEDGDAARGEHPEGPEPVVDPVERRTDIEPAERSVARP